MELLVADTLLAPHSARESSTRGQSRDSTRGQSRKYVQQTLHKLGEDSLRIGRRLDAEAVWNPNALPPLQGAPRLPSLEATRNFSAGPSANIAGAAGACTGATRSVDSTANMDMMSSCELGMESLLEVGNPNLPAALLAVASVINAWECEVRRNGDSWRQGVEIGEERWAALHLRLDQVQAQVEQIDANIEANRVKSVEFEQWLQPMLQTAFNKMEENTRAHVQQAAKDVKEQSDTSHESIKAYVSNLLRGAEDKTGNSHKSIGQQMKGLETMLGGLSKNEEFLRDTANRWQQSTEVAQSEIAEAMSQLGETQTQMSRLTQESAELRSSLEQAQAALEKATHAPGCDVLMKLKTIETRGNIRIDRQTGRIEFEKPIEFETPTDPLDAAFSQPDVTMPMLADVAEVSVLFKVPMALDVQTMPGKVPKGQADFWEDVAQARATLLGAELSRCGVAPAFLTSAGSVAPKGAKMGSLFIQLDQSIFAAPKPPSAGKGGGKSSSKSPKRR